MAESQLSPTGVMSQTRQRPLLDLGLALSLTAFIAWTPALATPAPIAGRSIAPLT